MTQPSTRLRIRFTKRNELRWISHRDLARVWERLLRRAEIQLTFSQGFHPKPKISFPSALALGIEALDEVVELEVNGTFDLAELQTRIVAQMPPGMELLSITIPPSKARYVASTYRIELPVELIDECRTRIAQLLQADAISVQRDGKQVHCEVRQPFFDINLVDNKLLFTLPIASQGTSLRPAELLQVLNLGDLLESGILLQRIQVHLDEVHLDEVHLDEVHLDESSTAMSSQETPENDENCEPDTSLLL